MTIAGLRINLDGKKYLVCTVKIPDELIQNELTATELLDKNEEIVIVLNRTFNDQFRLGGIARPPKTN